MKSNMLFIAEKPSLAKAIASGFTDNPVSKKGYLECPNNIIITWCYGHMLKLKSPRDYGIKSWSFEVLPFDMLRKPIYIKDKDKEEQINIIYSLIEKFDTIVNAGDTDDEGQRIVDSLLENSGVDLSKKEVLRIWLNANNKSVVIKELEKMKPNNIYNGLSQRALARAVADQIMGFNCTVAFSVKNNELLNTGRVSSPILGMVAKRMIDNKNHKESYYYNLQAKFKFNSDAFFAQLTNVDEIYLDDKGRIINLDFLEEISKKINNEIAEVLEFNVETIIQQPPLTYNLSDLQADCSKLYGFTPKKTQDITQVLRDKYQLITYNRTDSNYLNDEHHQEAPEVLKTALKNLNLNLDLKYDQKSRVFNSKKTTAHHAIICTESTMPNDIPDDCKKVYELIAKRYLIQFLEYREIERTSIKLKVKDYIFSTSSSIEKKSGWKSFDDTFKEEKEDSTDLPILKVGQGGAVIENTILKSKIEPPRLYTLQSLIKDLTRASKYIDDPDLKKVLIERDKGNEGENGGIGTTATRASIIETLMRNGFIEIVKNRVLATEKGMRFYELMPEKLKKPDITALWEIELKKIELGEKKLEDFISEVHMKTIEIVEEIKNSKEYLKEQFFCEKCNSPLRTINNTKTPFFACTSYPNCNQTYPMKDNKPDFEHKKEELLSDHLCKSCNSPLILRNGKYGEFFACSAYPKCKTSYKVNENKEPIYQ